MQTTKDRLLEFLKQIEISQAKFAERVGVSRNYVNSMVDNITQNTVEKIQAAYPDLNIDWLTKGQGEMLRTPTAADKQKKLPLIPFEAIAGYLSIDNVGVRFEDCEQYVIPEFEQRGAEFIIRVSGSSMYPKYSNGDLLGCKRVNDILFFQWGKIYVLDTSQGTLVKRVYEHENDDFVMLVSDNKAVYPPFAIPKSDIRSLSIVVGVVRLE